ncbi:MAG: lipopolysaccharide export system protein LptA [Methylophagaceae bacterium]|jgi:lipopolysaccharide export system protein LptA
MMHRLQTKLLIALIALLPSLSWALPSDRSQPIDIEADHAELDDASGITQYKGRAILTQGTLRIEGDIITFYYDDDKQLTKAVAQGNLATYKQVQKLGEEPVRARALQMEYHAKAQKIYLLGQGHVWRSGDEFSGNKIEYDINNNVVNANSAPVEVAGEKQESGRVHIIIQPPGSKKKATAPKIEANTKVEVAPIDNKETDQYLTASTTTTLNVRTGPGIKYNRIGTFGSNSDVIILTEQKEWVQVRGEIDDQVVIGWVNRRYIQVKP